METKIDQKQKNYLKRLNELYKEVKKWTKTRALVVKEKEVNLNEELLGQYKAPGLLIIDKKGEKIAELQPVGASDNWRKWACRCDRETRPNVPCLFRTFWTKAHHHRKSEQRGDSKTVETAFSWCR